jgi:Spy/CpxP family protein refolding chaperone
VKFKAICDAQQPAQQAIRNNSTLSAADKQTQMSAIYATIKVQLKAILTPAQIAQMAQASTTTTSTTPIKVFGVTLTPAEAVQFKAIYSAQLPAKKAIRDNTTLSKAEKQTMMTEIYTSLREQLKAILTPEQIAQMEQTPPQTTKK